MKWRIGWSTVLALGLVLLAMPVSRAAADEAERREFAASVAGYVGTVVAVIPESRTLIVDAPFRNDVLRIGADKARKIVRYREARKGFRDWDDVGRTPGITSADLEAIRTRAWLGPPRTRGWIGTDRRRTGRGPGGRAASLAGFRRRTHGRARG